jgi:hypothetical protein
MHMVRNVLNYLNAVFYFILNYKHILYMLGLSWVLYPATKIVFNKIKITKLQIIHRAVLVRHRERLVILVARRSSVMNDCDYRNIFSKSARSMITVFLNNSTVD